MSSSLKHATGCSIKLPQHEYQMSYRCWRDSLVACGSRNWRRLFWCNLAGCTARLCVGIRSSKRSHGKTSRGEMAKKFRELRGNLKRVHSGRFTETTVPRWNDKCSGCKSRYRPCSNDRRKLVHENDILKQQSPSFTAPAAATAAWRRVPHKSRRFRIEDAEVEAHGQETPCQICVNSDGN